MNQIVLKAMNRLFPNADSSVDHDLLACALAHMKMNHPSHVF